VLVVGLVVAVLGPALAGPGAAVGGTGGAPVVRSSGERAPEPPGGGGSPPPRGAESPPPGGTGAPPPAPVPPPGAGEVAPGAAYAWPLAPPPAVLTPFRAPDHPFGPGHRGVDLAGRAGQPVLAAREGTVVFAGPVAGRGVVSVAHPDGLRSTYEPVVPTVASGAVVRRGDVLGLLAPGHGGCPAPACLHWGVRRDRLDHLDPLVLLRPARVRLLPVPVPWPAGPPGNGT
jgi:murein DD-endopeptidase MepM/ murein hydrolase activator NlpD